MSDPPSLHVTLDHMFPQIDHLLVFSIVQPAVPWVGSPRYAQPMYNLAITIIYLTLIHILDPYMLHTSSWACQSPLHHLCIPNGTKHKINSLIDAYEHLPMPQIHNQICNFRQPCHDM